MFFLVAFLMGGGDIARGFLFQRSFHWLVFCAVGNETPMCCESLRACKVFTRTHASGLVFQKVSTHRGFPEKRDRPGNCLLIQESKIGKPRLKTISLSPFASISTRVSERIFSFSLGSSVLILSAGMQNWYFVSGGCFPCFTYS